MRTCQHGHILDDPNAEPCYRKGCYELADRLDDDDLETIQIIARNGQSGRITEREVRLLVEAYRKANT